MALCDLKHSSEMVKVLFDDIMTYQSWKEKGLLLFDFISLYLFIDQELFKTRIVIEIAFDFKLFIVNVKTLIIAVFSELVFNVVVT